MKYLSSLTKLSLVFFAIFALSSCGTDESGNEFDTAPSVNLVEEAGFVSADANLAGETSFFVKVQGIAGTNDIETLTILEDDVKVDLARLSTSSNPVLLLDDDTKGFTTEVEITLHADQSERAYEFQVADATGLIGSQTIYINTAPTTTGPPVVTLASGTATRTLDGGSLFEIDVTAVLGGATLADIGVWEGADLITDLNRLRYGAVEIDNVFEANPLTVPVDDENGFTAKSIWVRAHEAEGVTTTYTVRVTDTNAEFADLSVDVSTFVSTSPIDNEFTAILVYNNSGPENGGLDLDTGSSVSSFDGSADLIDSGLDATDTWARTIYPANGASLRSLDPAQAETFSYDNVTSREALIEAYNTGFETTLSGTLFIGDTYTARANGSYYILTVRNIVEVADNDDYYEFDVKQAL